jgi:hypothetical protein
MTTSAFSRERPNAAVDGRAVTATPAAAVPISLRRVTRLYESVART